MPDTALNLMVGENKNKTGINLIGSGNMAWHLGVAFANKGVEINHIIARNRNEGEKLAKRTNALFTSDLSKATENAELIIIAISDSAIEDVALQIPETKALIAHTSGSMPIDVVAKKHKSAGVFYPFQTLSKSVETGKLKFPVCIEATGKTELSLLSNYANKISDQVEFLNSDRRKILHLSGVIINNFTNHLLARSFDFLDENQIDKKLLNSLIQETMRKALAEVPRDVQTGPAKRGDKEVLKKHLALLKNNSALSKIYEVMSAGIEEYYSQD